MTTSTSLDRAVDLLENAAASGVACSPVRDLVGSDETVVAVLGDGALTGGLAYEALNNAGALRSPFIVILNDNEMSIAPNVGSIAAYLSVLRTKPFANFVRRTGKEMLKRLPLGTAAKRAIACICCVRRAMPS